MLLPGALDSIQSMWPNNIMTTWISGPKPLTEPVLAYHINCSVTFKWEQIHKTVLWNSSAICVRRKLLPYLPGTSKLIIAALVNRVCLSWFQPMYRVSGADGIWQWTASLLRFPHCLLPTKAINVVAAVDWYLSNSINLPRKIRFLIFARYLSTASCTSSWSHCQQILLIFAVHNIWKVPLHRYTIRERQVFIHNIHTTAS